MDIRQKIERIVGFYLPATWKNSRKSATIELTNLFEREMAERDGRVLWEKELQIEHDTMSIIGSKEDMTLLWADDQPAEAVLKVFGKHIGKDGWSVQVVVYDQIPEKQAQIEKATDVDL